MDSLVQQRGQRGIARAGWSSTAAAGFWVALPVLAVVLGALLFLDLAGEVLAVVGIALMLCLVFMRVPVGIAMGVAGSLGIWSIRDAAAVTNTLERASWSTVSTWILSVIPMFVLMGVLLERSGATANIFRGVKALVGWVPGGLAVSTNFGGAAMGAASGSTLGVTYALGRICIPEMVRSGYDRRLATSAVLMAGTGAQLLPPSILLVVYAGLAQVPVGQQLMAGVIPGLLLPTLYGLMMVLMVLVRPGMAARNPERDEDATSVLRRLWVGLNVWPVLMLGAIILGGLYAGVFTATEAGAYGVLGVMFVVVVLRGWRSLWRGLGRALVDTLDATGSIFLVLIGGTILGRFLTLTGAPRSFAGAVDDAALSIVAFMLLVAVMYLLLGMFMDPVAMLLITVPVLLPVAQVLGVHPLVFGTFVVLLGEMALLTPPVGLLVYVVHGIARTEGVDIGIVDTFRGVFWFYPVTVLLLLLMVFFPGMVTWLPGLMS